MVDQEKKVREAHTIIDRLVGYGNLDRNQISFTVMKQTGFSEKFTHRYLDRCMDMDLVFEIKGVMTNKREKPEEEKEEIPTPDEVDNILGAKPV